MPSLASGVEGELLGSTDELSYDRTLVKYANRLTSYGLTINQARVYLFLLAKGPSAARLVSEALNLHRVDVYRKLRELENLGMLEQHLNSPRRFSAIDPKIAMAILLAKQEEKLTKSRQLSGELLPKLLGLKNSFDSSEWGRGDANGTYRLGSGRTRYHNEMRDLMRNARKEVLRVVSADGIVRNFQSGFYNEYFDAKARGVSIRMISEIDNRNRILARRLSKVVTIRHLDGIKLRFMVVDGSAAVFGTSYQSRLEDSTENCYMVFNDSKFAGAFSFFFEHLWSVASARLNLERGVGNTMLHSHA
jgi:sugar-specific transcriptional regulator TrmB